MNYLNWWQRWMVKPGRIRGWYWKWYTRRLLRWADRHDLPPRPSLDELLRRIETRQEEQ